MSRKRNSFLFAHPFMLPGERFFALQDTSSEPAREDLNQALLELHRIGKHHRETAVAQHVPRVVKQNAGPEHSDAPLSLSNPSPLYKHALAETALGPTRPDWKQASSDDLNRQRGAYARP